MLYAHYFRHIAVLMAVIMLVAAGCTSSAPSRFYTLSSLETTNSAGKNIIHEHIFIVAIGPITIPDYLDRPQIATRTGKNELTLAEFDRWPGSLKQDIVRVLIDNMSTLLKEKQISIVPWKRTISSGYRISVDIKSFDIYPDSHVLLKANWIIFDNEEQKIVTITDISYKEPLNGNGYDAAVAAMSGSLVSLSLDMAERIGRFVIREK